MADEKPAPAPLTSDPNEPIGDPVSDTPNPEIVADEPAPRPAAAEPADEPAAPPPNPRAAKMKAIAERLKKSRAGDNAPEFTGDFSDPTQTVGNYGRPEPEVDLTPAFVKPQDAPAADKPAGEAPAPKRIKLKVDDQEFERDLTEVARLADMTIEEVEANPERARRYAQKEIATERRLDKAKEILRGANQRPQDAAPTPGAHDAEPVPEPTAEPNQDGTFKKLIEDIQFGADSNELAKQFDDLLTRKATEIARGTSLEQKMREDLTHTLDTYQSMKAADATLFADPNAEAVMERMLYDGYREDLRAIGVPDDRIPQNPKELADWHRLQRVQGRKVRTADKLLGDVKEKYVKWRGITPSAKPTPAPRETQPRVVVDRTERRQAIPTQPARAGAPPQVPSGNAPQKTSRSEAMNRMRKARGQVTA